MLSKKIFKFGNVIFFLFPFFFSLFIYISLSKFLESYYPLKIFYLLILFILILNFLFWVYSFFRKKKKEFLLFNISLYLFFLILNYCLLKFNDKDRELKFLKKYEEFYIKKNIHLNFRPASLNKYEDLDIRPLGSIPNKKIFFCNEDLKKNLFIKNDKYGFNNPANTKYFNSEIMLIGDSFTQGECVPNKDNISNNLKKLFINKEVLNFGMGGSGPISHLAIIKEYAVFFRPKNILIFVIGNNDRWDLNNEYQNKILSNYINDENYTQNLINKNDLINDLINKFINDNYNEIYLRQNSLFLKTKNILTFQKMRAFLSSLTFKLLDKKNTNYNFELDKQVVHLTSKTAKKINSNLFFIYLPDYYELFSENTENIILRKKYIQILKDNRIEYINFYPLFKKLINKKNFKEEDFFVLGKPNNHYTSKIYKFIADSIAEKNILKF